MGRHRAQPDTSSRSPRAPFSALKSSISGQEIEEVLLEHPSVGECAVVGVAHRDRGHIVKAFIVLRKGENGGDDLSRAIQDFVKKSIVLYKYPRAVEFVDELPKTQTGKVNRAMLRARG